MHSFHGRWHWRQSHNLQCGLCVLQRVWDKERRSTMVRYSFQEQAEMMFVYGQEGGNGREAARMYRAITLTGSTTHITQHLESFIGVWDRPTCKVAADCAYTRCGGTCSVWYWEQPWYKLQASGPPTWCKPKDDYLYPTWQLLLSLSPPACAGVITGRFSSTGKILSLVCVTGHHHYGTFCLRTSSPTKRPLVAMASLTCIIVIFGLNPRGMVVLQPHCLSYCQWHVLQQWRQRVLQEGQIGFSVHNCSK